MRKKRMIIYCALIFGIVISSSILTGNDLAPSANSDMLNRFVISDISFPRSATPDSCVYPATYDIEYNTSYLL